MLLVIGPREDIPAARAISLIAALIVTTVLVVALFFRFGGQYLPFSALIARTTAILRSPALPIAVLLYLLFFCALGEMTVAVLYGITDRWVWSVSGPFTVAYTAAWFIGYITPGAPGGLGMREAALVVPLGPSLGEATALSVSAGLRCLTILGDLLLFAACPCWNPWRI